MAVQAQYCGSEAAPACLARGDGNGGATAEGLEAQMLALQDYGALLAAAAGNNYNCAVFSGPQSELTCNNGAPSRKRGREQYVQPPQAAAALLPIPGMAKAVESRMVESALTSTSGRPPAAAATSVANGLVTEMYQHNVEIDALVRLQCERLRVGVEQARKRQCQAVARVAEAAAAQRLREKEAELDAMRRRCAELEERLRQAAAESQAWFGLARSNEAVAADLRTTLGQLLLRTAATAPAESFGDNDPNATASAAVADDAQSCCFAPATVAGKWACKACGEREVCVLLLPCRHLCLCKSCEPKVDICPVCLAAKNASIHIAMN